MPRILFIADHRPCRSPSQRFRFEQYFDVLKNNNNSLELSYIISKKDDAILYNKGNFLKKVFIQLKSYLIRLKNVLYANKYDFIFIHREALLTRSVFFEWCFSKTKAKVIYDFDDAIWLPNVSNQNKNLEWLKNYNKTKKIISYSNQITVGNEYLKQYALNYNKNVCIIPTTIDTEYHIPKTEKNNSGKICIGWTGSHTTIKHFELIIPTLIKLKNKYEDRIYFKVIGDGSFINSELDIIGVKWNLNTEIQDLQEIDIGIMPLEDNDWSRGKCGFKGLQYMALEIPPVISPVGVNTKIIDHSKNGYLAKTENDWLTYLSLLIDDELLRYSIGKNARKTIIEEYSVISQKDNYISLFTS